jgi:hypothetical protein
MCGVNRSTPSLSAELCASFHSFTTNVPTRSTRANHWSRVTVIVYSKHNTSKSIARSEATTNLRQRPPGPSNSTWHYNIKAPTLQGKSRCPFATGFAGFSGRPFLTSTVVSSGNLGSSLAHPPYITNLGLSIVFNPLLIQSDLGRDGETGEETEIVVFWIATASYELHQTRRRAELYPC